MGVPAAEGESGDGAAVGDQKMIVVAGHRAQAFSEPERGRDAASPRRARVLAERERIAGELHDTAIQRIFVSAMAIRSVQQRTADPLLRDELDQIIGQLDHAIADIKSAVLRPGPGRSGEETGGAGTSAPGVTVLGA
jgi:signal transduction histidine kinase